MCILTSIMKFLSQLNIKKIIVITVIFYLQEISKIHPVLNHKLKRSTRQDRDDFIILQLHIIVDLISSHLDNGFSRRKITTLSVSCCIFSANIQSLSSRWWHFHYIKGWRMDINPST